MVITDDVQSPLGVFRLEATAASLVSVRQVLPEKAQFAAAFAAKELRVLADTIEARAVAMQAMLAKAA